LWKSVQISGFWQQADELRVPGSGFVSVQGGLQVNLVRACSACSGDYEDPEESVWDDPNEEDAGKPDIENAEQPEARE
jgi:hypothetical protein